MGNDIVIGATMKSTITSIQRARENVDRASERLATGKKVNSALDQPQNFFTASALNFQATSYNKLLDKMGLGIQTLKEAMHGVEALEKLLNLAEIKAVEAKETLEKTSSALPKAILADNPVGYFRLNDSDAPVAANLGSLGAGGDGIYTNGVGQSKEILFYGAGGNAATFDGTNQYIAIPNDNSINTPGPFPQRTVELIFNADNTGGRQVLFEEGGSTNSLNIYIDNGLLRVNGRTTNAGGYGPLNISVPIESGITYHVAFTQDGPNQRFTGYLNGEIIGTADLGGAFIGNHPNFNGIGAINQNIYFHDDGPGNSPARPNGSFAFDGQISDVAIYNSIIDQEGMRARYEATSLPLSEQFRKETQVFLDQVTGLTEDTSFRGINLLRKEEIVVDFNYERTSKLKVTGQDFTLESLGLSDINFQKPSQVEDAIISIRKAIAKVRDFGNKLATNFAIIATRQDFTRSIVNTLKSGASDLLNADMNEEGANLLAGQVRLDLATTALSLASQSQQRVLSLFS